jgi:hypothetical protein
MTAEPQLVVGDFNALRTDPTHADMLAAGFIDIGGTLGAVGGLVARPPTSTIRFRSSAAASTSCSSAVLQARAAVMQPLPQFLDML